MLSTIILLICLLISPLMGQQSAEHRIALLNGELFGLDRSHSTLKFTVDVFGMVETEGTFDDYTATILYNEEDITKTEVIVRIQAESIDTGSDFRDRDLNSERFLHTEEYPEIVFKSTSVDRATDGYLLHGDLTIKGITKRISIPIQHVLKRTLDPSWGNTHIGFTGQTTINRYDYNVTGGDSWGTEMLSDEIQISFSMLGRIFDMNKIGYRNQEKKSIGELLEQKIKSEGISDAISFYRTVNKYEPDSINISARELYVLTHRLKQNNEIKNAIKIGGLYIQSYPDSPSANATMAELMAIQGNREKAIKYYQDVLYLEPEDKAEVDIANIALDRLKRD